jgi:hypothetical protein
MKDYPYMIRWTLRQLVATILHRPAYGYARTLTFREILERGGWK